MLSEEKNGNFEVYVERPDGTRFNEHDTRYSPATESEPSLTECWLESEDGQIFQLRIKKTSRCPKHLYDSGWQAAAKADGQYLSGAAVPAGYLAGEDGVQVRKAAVNTDKGVQSCSVQFRRHDFTSEEKDVTIKPGEMANLGIIEMVMTRGTFTKGDVSIPKGWKGMDQGPVLEGKQQKLGSKVTGVNPVPAQPLQNFHFKPLQGPGAVKHKFVFKYRTKMVLELMNVIEPPALPVNAEPVQQPNAQAGPKGKRRRRDSFDDPIDLTSEGPEDVVDAKPLEKIRLQEKRIRYLESLIAGKRSRTSAASIDKAVDLTRDDE